MKKFCLVIAVLALLCMSVTAQATAIQGSTAFLFLGSVTQSGHALTFPQPTGGATGVVAQSGFGDFSVVPFVFPTSLTCLSSGVLDLNSPAGWTFGSADFGSWVTSSATHTHSSGYVNTISLQGIFAPGTMFGGLTASNAIMTIGFSSASNGSATFAMTSPVPEPSSIMALAGGLGSLILFRRRRA
jgi:hypothetical protein